MSAVIGRNISQSRMMALLKESYYLSDQLAAMNNRIKAQLDSQNGKLAEWIDAHPVAKWVKDKAVDKTEHAALRAIFDEILKVLGASFRIGDAELTAFTGIFTSRNLDSPGARREYYFDDHPSEMMEYEKNKARLRAIYSELFWLYPPNPVEIHENRCAVEACWRSR